MTHRSGPPTTGRSQPASSPVNRFTHSCVRDLYWCLSSPAIYQLGTHNSELFQDRRKLRHWLRQLDANPEPLLEAISQQRSFRLGIYFETLMQFALTRFIAPAREFYALAVRSNSRTIGEYDFLLRRHGRPALTHIEVSVKFYLGLPFSNRNTHWLGLNRNDRLFDKRDKMQGKQLQLSDHPLAQQQLKQVREQVGARIGIIKGRLFYPFGGNSTPKPDGARQQHLQGWWLRQGLQQRLVEPNGPKDHLVSQPLLVPLQRRQWLAPLSPQDADELAQPLSQVQKETQGKAQKEKREPGMYARLISTPYGWREHDRGVIVDEGWLQSVLKTLQ